MCLHSCKGQCVGRLFSFSQAIASNVLVVELAGLLVKGFAAQIEHIR